MLLYWPTTGLALGTGKLIGWKLSGAACVVAIVNDKVGDIIFKGPLRMVINAQFKG